MDSPFTSVKGAMANAEQPRRSRNTELEIAKWRQGDFQADGSSGARLIEGVAGGGKLSREMMIRVAQLFSDLSGIPFQRDWTRRRDLIVKWVDDHSQALQPLADIISVVVE
jgi:hypothetical protein